MNPTVRRIALATLLAAGLPAVAQTVHRVDPQHLFDIGARLAPLRDEGVLIVGSGFLTHGLPFIAEYFMGKPGAPQWSIDFDHWAKEALDRGDLDTLFAFREKAPNPPVGSIGAKAGLPAAVSLIW